MVPKHTHTAVERNRLKRRLRELARTGLLPRLAESRLDVVIRAKPEAYRPSFAELEREMSAVVGRVVGASPTA